MYTTAINASGRAIIGAALVGLAAALLAACSGSPLPAGTSGGGLAPEALAHSKTWHFTGSEQFFKVPEGAHFATISATGAIGGGRFGGYPGRVRARVPVVPGETLAIFVGGTASQHGFNGGAPGTSGSCPHHCHGRGGGGASDVREGGDSLQDRIVVAGGGGGTGGYEWRYGRGSANGTGGLGGGATAGEGGMNAGGGGGGGGGTQQYGGAGGTGCPAYNRGQGTSGTLGEGGVGGFQDGTGGGGGGGGYYGGGGGGSGGYGCDSGSGDGYPAWAGGGGGGSSYVEPSGTILHNYQGYPWAGNGIIVIQW